MHSVSGQQRAHSAFHPWQGRLSDRERQVAQCVASGLTNRDIAATLEITKKTVEKHLTRIFVKLGVRSRAQLAIYIVSTGPQ